MLKVDLGLLSREGFADVTSAVPANDSLWEGVNLAWKDDVSVELRVTMAGTGEVVARGKASGELKQECRRCLGAVERAVSEELTIVFSSEPEEEREESGAYAFEADGPDFDVSSAVREELVLAINPYVVCEPECAGLCATCGTNLNEASCDCVDDEIDPRWGALRALKSE